MKTWIQVQRRIERNHLPYRVKDETLVTLDGRAVACTVQAARDCFESPGHPDGKRQRRCKARNLARYGARILKRSGVFTCPVRRTNKRREVRDMKRRLEQEQQKMAAIVAARLLGIPKQEYRQCVDCRMTVDIDWLWENRCTVCAVRWKNAA